MNDSLYLIAIVAHIFSLILIIKNWGIRSLSYPGFFFSGLWFISTISEWYLVKLDYTPTPNPEYIDELNILSGYTSLCFAIISFWGVKYKNHDFLINIVSDVNKFVNFLHLMLVATLANFIVSGASLSFAQNRMNLVSDLNHIGKSYTFFDSIVSIIVSPLIFYNIAVGKELSNRLLYNSKRVSYFVIVEPLLLTIISSLSIGGRNPIVKTLKEYISGFGIGISKPISKKGVKKTTIMLFFTILLFSGFSTFVSRERNELNGVNIKEYDSEIASFFSGIMEYMSCHYWGYQLRRTDFSSGENKTYGIATFYGLGNISIPFSSTIGIKGNLWNLFGVDYDPLDVYKSQVEGFYTTSSVYSLLVRDFGPNFVFVVIFLLVIISQYIYISLFKNVKSTAISIIPYLCVFIFWSSSNFNFGFPTMQSLLIGALIFDFLQNNYKK